MEWHFLQGCQFVETRLAGRITGRSLPRVAGRSAARVAAKGLSQIGETGAINHATIMRALRQSGSIEGAATAKLIKRGFVEVELLEIAPTSWLWGQGGVAHWGSKRVQVLVTTARDAMGAAGLVAHEARHVVQRITPATYRRFHEFEAYKWQRAVDRHFKLSDEQIWELIRTHPLYQDVPM